MVVGGVVGKFVASGTEALTALVRVVSEAGFTFDEGAGVGVEGGRTTPGCVLPSNDLASA